MKKPIRIMTLTLLSALLIVSFTGYTPQSARGVVSPMITLNPPAGPVGTPVTVSGTDFTPGATVDLSWRGFIVDVPKISGHVDYYPIVTGINVAGDGSFTAKFTVPYDFCDVGHYVNATQDGVGAGITNATFTIIPSMTLTPQPSKYKDGQELMLHIYGAPLGTAALVLGLNPLNEVTVLKLTYDNAAWGFVVSHLATEGPIVTAGATGGDIGGNATVRLYALGGSGTHMIRGYEGEKGSVVPYLPCEIGGEVTFSIRGVGQATDIANGSVPNISNAMFNLGLPYNLANPESSLSLYNSSVIGIIAVTIVLCLAVALRYYKKPIV